LQGKLKLSYISQAMITKESRNILVADDSLFFRNKLTDVLIEAGHSVKVVKNGREAIEK